MAEGEPESKKLKGAADDHSTEHPVAPHVHVTEADVGICELINRKSRFKAVFKQRFSDFIVNEIDVHGNEVKLTNLDIPLFPDEVIKDIDKSIFSPEDISTLEKIVSIDTITEAILKTDCTDKGHRTKIHNAIKTYYPGLDSDTHEKDGTKYICVRQKKKGDKDTRWPKSCPSYLQFTLYKENKDTMDVIDLICRHIHLKPKLFTYSGTKDRRAKTCQLVTAHKIRAEKLMSGQKSLSNIAFGNFSYVKEPLSLGQLTGNRFYIVLRNVIGEESCIHDALLSLKENGFINYFGMQRFGTTSIPTHQIGRALLSSNWEEAVDLILRPRVGDKLEMLEARKIWTETHNAKQALLKLPKYSSIEKAILRHLSMFGSTNYFNAICTISYKTRLLYAHSYQSYIWNQIVSRRIHKFALQPIDGDLVNDSLSKPGTDNHPITITGSDLGAYSIYDVLLPLPGHSIIYPNNEVYDWYKELLSKDGFEIENLQHPKQEYSLPGAYRLMMTSVKDMEWQEVRYDDYMIPLTCSDYDLLMGRSEAADIPDGKYKALKMKFTLSSSCYATMALRELLDTTTDSQSNTAAT